MKMITEKGVVERDKWIDETICRECERKLVPVGIEKNYIIAVCPNKNCKLYALMRMVTK